MRTGNTMFVFLTQAHHLALSGIGFRLGFRVEEFVIFDVSTPIGPPGCSVEGRGRPGKMAACVWPGPGPDLHGPPLLTRLPR